MRSCCSLGHDASLTPGKDAFVKKVTKIHETTVKKKSTNRRGWSTKEAMEKKLQWSKFLGSNWYLLSSYMLRCTKFSPI